MKILLISDPHIDFATTDKKRFFLQPLEDVDMIVCTGDVANDPWDFRQFLDWFSMYNVPKYIVPGNHDLWWARTYKTWNYMVGQVSGGWICPPPDKLYSIVDDVLLINFWYWKYDWPEGVDAGNYRDFQELDVDALTVKSDRELGDLSDLTPTKLSVSHMSPRLDVPSAYKPNFLFVNPIIDKVVRAHHSKLHLFGHTHERVDKVLDGVRYVNHPIGYGFEGIRRHMGLEPSDPRPEYMLEDLIVKW